MESRDRGRPAPEGFDERDVSYLRDIQYATTANLDARVALHEQFSSAEREWFVWLVDQVPWSGVADVLEVGCGTGLLWTRVPRSIGEGLSVTLTDLSETMVRTAVTRATTSVAVVDGFIVDASDLPFDDASFNLVIANHMLYHVLDPRHVLGEIARVLRPGGTVVAATNGPRHLRELYEINEVVFGGSARRQMVETFGSVSGNELLLEHFENVHWRAHDDRLLCNDPVAVIEYLTSAPPGMDAAPEKLADLRAEVVRRMTSSGGVLTVSKESGVFIANTASTSSSAGSSGAD